jgi:hypothetical protein
MKKTIFKTAVVVLTAFMTFSCSKDGATGPAGANGINGNANVVGSLPFSTASSNWGALNGGTVWTASMTGQTAITQSVVDKGIVSVFRKYTSGGVTEWSPLPDTNTNINISYNFGVGNITFYAQSTNGVVISNPGIITFRYVIITPSNKLANPNTNWKNYEEVKLALHLKD